MNLLTDIFMKKYKKKFFMASVKVKSLNYFYDGKLTSVCLL